MPAGCRRYPWRLDLLPVKLAGWGRSDKDATKKLFNVKITFSFLPIHHILVIVTRDVSWKMGMPIELIWPMTFQNTWEGRFHVSRNLMITLETWIASRRRWPLCESQRVRHSHKRKCPTLSMRVRVLGPATKASIRPKPCSSSKRETHDYSCRAWTFHLSALAVGLVEFLQKGSLCSPPQ